MALIKELKGSFVGGKVSKPLQNRTDLEKFNTWLTEAKNTQIKPEGSISNRAGTVFIGTTKKSYKLTVNVNVSATIIINGTEYTNITTKSINLEEGSEYTYSVSAVGYETKSGSGTLDENKVIDVTLEEDANTYTFTIDNGEQGATITINGTEQSSLTASAGTYIEWSVEKEGYISQSGSFLLSEDTTEEVTLEPIKYKIYYCYYDNETQSIKLDLFKEVDSYNFKDVVPEYTSRCFVADGSVYKVQNGSFTKMVDGNCSSCSGSFYVQNGVIRKIGSIAYNDSYTWDRIGYCGDIKKIFALTTTGDLYKIDVNNNGDITSTTTFVQSDIVDLKCTGLGCLYCKKSSGNKYVYFNDGTTETIQKTTGEEKDVQLVYGYKLNGNQSLFVVNKQLYMNNNLWANNCGCASGFYNFTGSFGYCYYTKDGKLYFRQNTSGEQTIDEGTEWTGISINLSANFTRNSGYISLGICNGNLYFINQYLISGYPTTYMIDTPALINAQTKFIEVYTLRNEASTNNSPVMFAIARDI